MIQSVEIKISKLRNLHCTTQGSHKIVFLYKKNLGFAVRDDLNSFKKKMGGATPSFPVYDDSLSFEQLLRRQAPSQITHLSFGGGSVRGIAEIGAYDEFLRQKLLGNLRGASGTSAGAMMALMVGLRFSTKEMLDVLTSKLFLEILGTLYPRFADNRRRTFYLLDWSPVRERLHDMMEAKGLSRDPDFATFFARTGGFDLRLPAVQVETQKVQMFSHERTPDSSVVDAVIASSSIPFAFRPEFVLDSELNCESFSDGGTQLMLPIAAFGPEAENGTFGVYLADKTRPGDFDAKFFGRMSATQRQNTLSIDVSNILGFLEFAFSERKKFSVYGLGRRVAADYIRERNLAS